MASKLLDQQHKEIVADEEEEEDEEEQIYGWDEWKDDEEDGEEPEFLCLFCDLKWCSVPALFQHCNLNHAFDFLAIQKSLDLDFYESLKLINYVRSQVSSNKCWICGLVFTSKELLHKHLHETSLFKKGERFPWQSEEYLQPFMKDDALLHSFATDDVSDDDVQLAVDREELIRELANVEALVRCSVEDGDGPSRGCNGVSHPFEGVGSSGIIDGSLCGYDHLVSTVVDDDVFKCLRVPEKPKAETLKEPFANVATREIISANENYFGSYGYFGIHREMLSDKVRMDAYSEAILCNPSLFHQATVMDVGCGTGVLSLFAAQAGALSVIAVEASDKIATKARQIVKDNGMLKEETGNENAGQNSGVIEVIQGTVEDLHELRQMPQNSVDVLLSEWMGYCLLYESMLSSVLMARDKWLKPGGAILPDTATIFVAGFGRGGTSIPFWENVYGFNMSCIVKDVAEDASRSPIIDTINNKDLVTDSMVLHKFDLVTMKLDEMDFTACVELRAREDQPGSCNDASSLCNKATPSEATECYGLVLWFDTSFTNRFCKEKATNLSTSPYTPKTHWYQTLLTFKEPIVMSAAPAAVSSASIVGADASPAAKIRSRISIARAARHRSIDISVEITAVSSDGRSHVRPAQIFNL